MESQEQTGGDDNGLFANTNAVAQCSKKYGNWEQSKMRDHKILMNTYKSGDVLPFPVIIMLMYVIVCTGLLYYTCMLCL